jgi:transcription elongation factor
MNDLPDECKAQYKQPGWMAKGRKTPAYDADGANAGDKVAA